ncbi:MAG: tyrosine-protein phosphatase [Gemmataceae bacterium]
MIPLIDLHCHLLAGLDDGPRTQEDALEMCRIMTQEGIQMSVALSHQNHRWQVTPTEIREATELLRKVLREEGVSLAIFPSSEVMVAPDTPEQWRQGNLLSINDQSKVLLIEMPRGVFVDLEPTVVQLQKDGVRPLLAHPEQQPEFMEDTELLESLIRAGCLVQVSAGNLTKSLTKKEEKTFKDWFRRGLVHVLGSDGHSPRKRQPRMQDAYQQVVNWVGRQIADQVFYTNGMTVLQGLPLKVPPPKPKSKLWFLPF